ncbi:HalX domain-containing protein [Natrinema halophilum]|uniref:HalX domain-containing protein n=1 Tax=Natrinema halophilum TaxID=1699371 RepID=A0A7D5GIJ9_9EURY|nr:HalX domain-containing protein [Natrinema halophilum]QLG47690.1 HalX domain-containing protein [Natrinema halophilum]
MSGDAHAVLVADDDSEVVTRIQSWLADDYVVETATDGDEALSLLESVDAVLVGRNLHTSSGTAVAMEVERHAALSMAVLRSTGPGTDSCTSTPDSLAKPVAKEPLLETVDRLVRRTRYDELMAECASLAVKCGALETQVNVDCYAGDDEEYVTLQQRLANLLVELDDLIHTFDGNDFRAAFATCDFIGNAQSQHAERLS